MTFKERFQARECSFNMIEDWIELWHTWDIKMALPAFCWSKAMMRWPVG